MPLSDRENLIIHTMVMRLSEKESLEYMHNHGHKIKIATYRKDKAIIKKNSDKRKFELIQDGLWEQHMERIDQLETILQLGWKNYHNEKDAFKKVKILETLANIQPLLSTYYSATQRVIENDVQVKGILSRGTLPKSDK